MCVKITISLIEASEIYEDDDIPRVIFFLVQELRARSIRIKSARLPFFLVGGLCMIDLTRPMRFMEAMMAPIFPRSSITNDDSDETKRTKGNVNP